MFRAKSILVKISNQTNFRQRDLTLFFFVIISTMPSIAELEKTKAELALALQELDQLERLSCKVNGAAGGNVVLQQPQQQPNNDGVQVQVCQY